MARIDLEEFNQRIDELAKQRDAEHRAKTQWRAVAIWGWAMIAGFIFREILK